MSRPPPADRLAFLTRRQQRRLGDCPDLTADDWKHVSFAYQAFQVQVRAIVWDAQHRGKTRR